MKKYFLFYCFLGLVSLLPAQTSFVLQIDSSKMCYPRDLLFTPSGNIVFCAMAWEQGNPYYFNYIYEVNNIGEIVNSWSQMSSSYYSIDCQRLIRKDNYYYLFGDGDINDQSSTLFVFMKKFDLQLNELSSFNYYLDNSLYKGINHVARVIKVDTVFKYYSTAFFNSTYIKMAPFSITMALNGDLIRHSHDMNALPPVMLSDVIEKQNPPEINAFVITLDQFNLSTGYIYNYDKNLLLLSRTQLPDNLNGFFSSLTLNDSVFYVAGNHRSPLPDSIKQVGVLKMKTDGTLLNDYLFYSSADSISYPAYYNSLDYAADGNLILCSSYGIIGQFMPQQAPSFICLYKLSPDLKLIWQRYIGGEANYEAYSMRVAPDSGIVVIGKYCKVPPQSLVKQEMIIIKTDKDGIVTTTGQQETEIKTTEAILYPNPAGEKITVDFSQLYNSATLQLMDISGKTVFISQLTSNRQTIDISALPAGTYLYRISNPKGLEETGKLVVE